MTSIRNLQIRARNVDVRARNVDIRARNTNIRARKTAAAKALWDAKGAELMDAVRAARDELVKAEDIRLPNRNQRIVIVKKMKAHREAKDVFTKHWRSGPFSISSSRNSIRTSTHVQTENYFVTRNWTN